MANYSEGVINTIGLAPYDTLKDAVSEGYIVKQECIDFSQQISLKVRTLVVQDIETNGFGRHTVDTMLGQWFRIHHSSPNEISLARIVEILRSKDIANSALAVKVMTANKMSARNTKCESETELMEEAKDSVQSLPQKKKKTRYKYEGASNKSTSNVPRTETWMAEKFGKFKKKTTALTRALTTSETKRKEEMEKNEALEKAMHESQRTVRESQRALRESQRGEAALVEQLEKLKLDHNQNRKQKVSLQCHDQLSPVIDY